MSFDRNAVLLLAEKYESFYLYDGRTIAENIAVLQGNFEGVRFLYSVKANPHPAVLRCIIDEGVGVDAASLREVTMGKENGLAAGDIYYSAPGKSPRDINAALGCSTIIADSPAEVERIQAIAEGHGITADIGIRLNPDFSFDGEGGSASKFGIDEEEAFRLLPQWKGYKNVRIRGIHVHSRSQELRGELIAAYYGRMFELAVRFQNALGHELRFVNMGSGIGIPYAEQDAPVDIKALGASMSALIRQYRPQLPRTEILVESGRFIVGKAGVYATHVMDKKVSHGRTFVLLANTLGGFVRPSVAQMVESYTREEKPAGCEPLYTGRNAFGFVPLTEDRDTETVTVTGSLCTGADVIAQDILLPRLECGDVFVITNAGSYAASVSPMQFASLEPPAQIFLPEFGEPSAL